MNTIAECLFLKNIDSNLVCHNLLTTRIDFEKECSYGQRYS